MTDEGGGRPWPAKPPFISGAGGDPGRRQPCACAGARRGGGAGRARRLDLTREPADRTPAGGDRCQRSDQPSGSAVPWAKRRTVGRTALRATTHACREGLSRDSAAPPRPRRAVRSQSDHISARPASRTAPAQDAEVQARRRRPLMGWAGSCDVVWKPPSARCEVALVYRAFRAKFGRLSTPPAAKPAGSGRMLDRDRPRRRAAAVGRHQVPCGRAHAISRRGRCLLLAAEVRGPAVSATTGPGHRQPAQAPPTW